MNDKTCGCLGCHEQATAVIDHPKHGKRTVCKDHVKHYKLIGLL